MFLYIIIKLNHSYSIRLIFSFILLSIESFCGFKVFNLKLQLCINFIQILLQIFFTSGAKEINADKITIN